MRNTKLSVILYHCRFLQQICVQSVTRYRPDGWESNSCCTIQITARCRPVVWRYHRIDLQYFQYQINFSFQDERVGMGCIDSRHRRYNWHFCSRMDGWPFRPEIFIARNGISRSSKLFSWNRSILIRILIECIQQLSYMCIIFAQNPYYLHVSRFLTGFVGGVVFVVIPLMVTEINIGDWIFKSILAASGKFAGFQLITCI